MVVLSGHAEGATHVSNRMTRPFSEREDAVEKAQGPQTPKRGGGFPFGLSPQRHQRTHPFWRISFVRFQRDTHSLCWLSIGFVPMGLRRLAKRRLKPAKFRCFERLKSTQRFKLLKPFLHFVHQRFEREPRRKLHLPVQMWFGAKFR